MRNSVDRATALETSQAKRLASTTVAQVNEALCALRNFMNAAAEHLGEAPTAYQHFVTGGGSGDNLNLAAPNGRTLSTSAKRGEDSMG
jgi:hypothetical protein